MLCLGAKVFVLFCLFVFNQHPNSQKYKLIKIQNESEEFFDIVIVSNKIYKKVILVIILMTQISKMSRIRINESIFYSTPIYIK